MRLFANFFRVSEVPLGIFLKNTNRVPLTQTGERRLLRLTIADPNDVRFAISHVLPKIPKQSWGFYRALWLTRTMERS